MGYSRRRSRSMQKTKQINGFIKFVVFFATIMKSPTSSRWNSSTESQTFKTSKKRSKTTSMRPRVDVTFARKPMDSSWSAWRNSAVSKFIRFASKKISARRSSILWKVLIVTIILTNFHKQPKPKTKKKWTLICWVGNSMPNCKIISRSTTMATCLGIWTSLCSKTSHSSRNTAAAAQAPNYSLLRALLLNLPNSSSKEKTCRTRGHRDLIYRSVVVKFTLSARIIAMSQSFAAWTRSLTVRRCSCVNSAWCGTMRSVNRLAGPI